MAGSGDLKILVTAASFHAPPPKGGTPYLDARFHARSGGNARMFWGILSSIEEDREKKAPSRI